MTSDPAVEWAGGGGVALAVEVRIREGGLTLSLSLDNRTSEGILAYVHPDDGERSAVLPGAYVCVAAATRELRVLLGSPPVPNHFFVPRGVLPLARRIAPGGSYRAEIDFDVPVREWTPYLEEEPPGEPEEVSVDHGVLRIEYFRLDRVLWSEPGPEEGTFWAEGLETLSVVAPFALPQSIPALMRRGHVERW